MAGQGDRPVAGLGTPEPIDQASKWVLPAMNPGGQSFGVDPGMPVNATGDSGLNRIQGQIQGIARESVAASYSDRTLVAKFNMNGAFHLLPAATTRQGQRGFIDSVGKSSQRKKQTVAGLQQLRMTQDLLVVPDKNLHFGLRVGAWG